MNKDFHYYGTYYAARFAGYSREDAEEIAWAAQMVDDFTYDNFKNIFNSDKRVVFTCEDSFIDYAKAELSQLSDVNNAELQKNRRIWSAFHFLPGNMRHELVSKKGFKANLESFSIDRDLPDFKCICAPNSELVKALIEKAANNRSRSNIQVGILMHVLADTWAHQYFVGSPNKHINNISDMCVFGKPAQGRTSPDLAGVYSMLYLGHARVGHNPDIARMNYSYNSSWANEIINVENPIRYYNAFFQMVDALRFIKNGGETFILKDYYLSRTRVTENYYAEKKFKNLLIGGHDDISAMWSEVYDETESPCDYDLKINNKPLLEQFADEALVHLSFVMDYVEAKVPGYFR